MECEYYETTPPVLDDEGWGGGGDTTPPETDPCEVPDENIIDLPVDCEEEEEEVFEIRNNVKDLCVRRSVQDAIDLDFKTKISELIQDVFDKNENVRVDIDGVTWLDDSIDGTTFSSVSNGFPMFIIELNMNILKNSSKEYISITVFHEFLHAYIIYLDNMEISDQSIQHQLMIDQYISMLSQTMQNIYGINENDAIHLAWGGLQDTDSWKKKSESFKNAVSNTNQKYRTGEKGTLCGSL